MKPHRTLTAAALLAIASLGACSDDGAPTVEAPIPATDTADAAYFASLCDVIVDAAAGDIHAARSGFEHGPLHELADGLLEVDRGVAADLLEAKEAVESTLADDNADPAAAAALVTDLTEATRAAYDAAGQTVPEPCDQENS